MSFIRRFIRRNFRPIPQEIAYKWNKRLSLIYKICLWNALGAGLYIYFAVLPKEARDFSPEVYVNLFKPTNSATIVKIRGFEIQDMYDYKTPLVEEPNLDDGNTPKTAEATTTPVASK